MKEFSKIPVRDAAALCSIKTNFRGEFQIDIYTMSSVQDACPVARLLALYPLDLQSLTSIRLSRREYGNVRKVLRARSRSPTGTDSRGSSGVPS